MRPPDITIEITNCTDKNGGVWQVDAKCDAMDYDKTFLAPDLLDALTALQRTLAYTMGGVALRKADDDGR